MDLRKAFLERSSKEQVIQIIDFLGTNEGRMADLMQIFLEGEPQERQRAAWVVYHFTPQQQVISQPYFARMLDGLTEDAHQAVWRATMRLFYYAGMPEELEGRIVSVAFDILSDPKQAVASKMFSMCILGDFCLKEPDLADELRGLIEEQWPTASAGFKSRGRKVLQLLDDLKRKKV